MLEGYLVVNELSGKPNCSCKHEREIKMQEVVPKVLYSVMPVHPGNKNEV